MFLSLETGGRRSHILHESGRRHFWQGAGALSIKSFTGGRALYDVGGGRFAVDDRSYLVLNEGQTYSITVDSRSPMESFCIFFGRGLAEEVERSLLAQPGTLLDDPSGVSPAVRFFERTYPHDEMLSPALFRLREALARGRHDPAWLEERLHDLLERLLWVHRGARAEADSLASLRRATREELYRRLHRARDHVAASLEGRLTLEELGRVACLSPNHLLRSFRQLFGQTPHQYVTERRLERARELLIRTERPVTDICLDVGFESLGSFSWLFRRRTGISPERYRRGAASRER